MEHRSNWQIEVERFDKTEQWNEDSRTIKGVYMHKEVILLRTLGDIVNRAKVGQRTPASVYHGARRSGNTSAELHNS